MFKNIKSLKSLKGKTDPFYFFTPKDFKNKKTYDKGFKIDELFPIYTSGVETAKDKVVIQKSEKEIKNVLSDFLELERSELQSKYEINQDKVNQVCDDLKRNEYQIKDILYRPFDIRKTIYTSKSQGVIWRPRYSIMKNMLKDNLGLIAKRGFSEEKSAPAFISKSMTDRRAWSRPGMQGAESIFPLYIYEDEQTLIKGDE